jgi:hypothetical protein
MRVTMGRTRRARWSIPAIALLLAPAGCARQAAELAGQWQLAWQGRIGTEHAMILLQPHGQVLKGEFRTAQGSVPLVGSVHGQELSFAVTFPGPPQYRILFSGTAQGNQIGGRAQPQDGNGHPIAGHGGEVSQQYYTWTAARVTP